jgi:hypothetical protein
LRQQLCGSTVATKTPAATAMAGAQTTINNQLKAAAATVMETATMTATTKTNKWRQHSIGGSGSAAAVAEARRLGNLTSIALSILPPICTFGTTLPFSALDAAPNLLFLSLVDIMMLLRLLVDGKNYFYDKIPRGLLLEHAPPTRNATIEQLFSCMLHNWLFRLQASKSCSQFAVLFGQHSFQSSG